MDPLDKLFQFPLRAQNLIELLDNISDHLVVDYVFADGFLC